MGEIPDSIKTAAAGTESGGGKQEGHYDCPTLGCPGEEGRKLGRGVLTGCDDMTGGCDDMTGGDEARCGTLRCPPSRVTLHRCRGAAKQRGPGDRNQ